MVDRKAAAPLDLHKPRLMARIRFAAAVTLVLLIIQLKLGIQTIRPAR